MHEIGCPANRWNRTYVAGTWPPPLATTFKTCGVCGLEWRGAEVCPRCERNILMGTGASWAIAERDQARDWCRMLVALVRAYHDGYCFLAWTDAQRCEALYEALPPELRAAIEE